MLTQTLGFLDDPAIDSPHCDHPLDAMPFDAVFASDGDLAELLVDAEPQTTSLADPVAQSAPALVPSTLVTIAAEDTTIVEPQTGTGPTMTAPRRKSRLMAFCATACFLLSGLLLAPRAAELSTALYSSAVADSPAGTLLVTRPIEQIRPGERLRTAAGRLTYVLSITPRPSAEPVYNFEVDLEHVYHVGETGILVHNAGGGLEGKFFQPPPNLAQIPWVRNDSTADFSFKGDHNGNKLELKLHPDPNNHGGSWDLTGVIDRAEKDSKIRLDTAGNVLQLKNDGTAEKHQRRLKSVLGVAANIVKRLGERPRDLRKKKDC